MTPTRTSGEADGARCFLALLPDAASRDALRHWRMAHERVITGATRGLRWVDIASLHLTVRFFGDAGNAQIDYLTHMLPTLVRDLPAIASRRCAIWPNRARPRLLVLELDAPEALRMLARECEALARKTGFEPEPRAFKAHLTLARLRPGCTPGIPSAPLPALTFESLVLMSSNQMIAGSRYHSLASAALSVLENPDARNSETR